MNIKDWLATNEHALGSPYEKLFVEKVLSSIKDLDLSALRAQYPFKDADGKQRYCDFVLIEGRAIRIAIEIDGYDKRGTGTGMTKEEFLDWQRRQVAFTSQGWYVLRFANIDVRDQPQRCKDHIELLLRRERLKQQHQTTLANDIAIFKEKLTAIEKGRHRTGTEIEKKRLQEDLETLKKQLKYARDARPLDTKEMALLEKFQLAQKQIEILTSENKIMKTTIWAFATIISVIIVTFALKGGWESPHQVTATAQQNTVSANLTNAQVLPSPQRTDPVVGQQNAKQGESCDNPINWRDAGHHVGAKVALAGPVVQVTHRQDVKGKPTWIEIGAGFPSRERVTLVIWGKNRSVFEPQITKLTDGQRVCIVGTIERYRDTTQIELRDSFQIKTF